MATPVGHVLAGYGTFLLTNKKKAPHRMALVFLCMIYAIAPDLDFLPGLFVGQPALYHQGLSHSILAALLAGLVGAVVFKKLGPSSAAMLCMLTGAYLSHLILDLLGSDGRAPYGIPLFWPFSTNHYLSPIALLPGVRHAASTDTATVDWLLAVLSWPNVVAIGIEIMVVSPFILLASAVRSRRKRAS